MVPPNEFELNKLLADGAQVRCGGPFYEATIVSVGDLVRIVESCHHGSFQYRGVGSVDYELKPSLTRLGGPAQTGLGPGQTWEDKEQKILDDFKEQSPVLSEFGDIRVATPLEVAVMAQHYLTPTRLLDWTMNPLAALYFAVNAKPADPNLKDPVVWAIAGDRKRFDILKNQPFNLLPLEPVLFLPHHTIPRIAAQASLFAVWRDPMQKSFDQALSDGSRKTMWKIVVPEAKRDDIRGGMKWLLHLIGINEVALFPDLDGLSRHLKWKHRSVWEDLYGRTMIPRPKTGP